MVAPPRPRDLVTHPMRRCNKTALKHCRSKAENPSQTGALQKTIGVDIDGHAHIVGRLNCWHPSGKIALQIDVPFRLD